MKIICPSFRLQKCVFNTLKGVCGHLNFLELFLHFNGRENPFNRPLNLRPLLGNQNVGDHGPRMYDFDYRPGTRNQNIPYGQTGGRRRGRRHGPAAATRSSTRGST